MRKALVAALALAAMITPAPGRAEGAPNEPTTWLSFKKACELKSAEAPWYCALVKDGLPTAEAWRGRDKVKGGTGDRGGEIVEKSTRSLDAGLSADAGKIAPPTPVSESALAWGVTQFVMSRAEAELRLWLVDRVFDTICDQEIDGSGPLLPETCALREQLHLTGIEASPGLLKDAVERDLSTMPGVVLWGAVNGLPDRVKAAKADLEARTRELEAARAKLALASKGSATAALEEDVKKAATAERAAKAALDRLIAASEATAVAYQVTGLMRTLQQGDDPREAFAAVAGLGIQKVESDHTKVASWIESGASLVAMLHAVDDRSGPVWPGEKDWGYVLLSVSSNREAGRLNGPGWAKPTAPSSPSELDWQFRLVTRLKEFSQSAEAARRNLEDLKKKLASAQAEGTRPAANARLLAAIVAESLRGAQALAEIARGEALTKQQAANLALARDLMEALSTGDYLTASSRLVTVATQCMKPGKAQRLFIRGTSMALEVAGAKDSAGVEAALNRYAAPAGSYVGKHRGDALYIGVNAYFGLALALELAKQEQGGWHDAKWGRLAGVWAPVGLEVGKSTPLGSIGIFGQVIDVGVLASWRMKNPDSDQVSSPPAVGFRQIVSPGGYLVWGWPGQPVSVALGAALSPSLREVGGDSSKQRDAWRFGINFALDIPVFP